MERPKSPKFVDGGRKSAPRKPGKQWDELKPIIMEKFETDTLVNVMEFMEQEHSFFATKRQYVYRLQNWGCTKYKKGPDKSPPAPNGRGGPGPVRGPIGGEGSDEDAVPLDPRLPAPTAVQEPPPQQVAAPVLGPPALGPSVLVMPDQRLWVWLADILSALGATHCSFKISSRLRDAMACVRTAQTQAQDDVARELVRAFMRTWPGDDQTWDTRFWDLALAHTYVRDSDAVHGSQQIASITMAIIAEDDESRDRLEFLTPREPRLDIPAYIFLRSAMEWYNRGHEGGEFDIPRVLDQFIRQQLAPRGLERRVGPLSTNCISSCLAWCIDTLKHPGTTPPRTLPLPPIGNPTAETYLVLCTLWHLFLSQHILHPPTPNGQPTPLVPPIPLPWADTAQRQLGIRPTELLRTVVCMIMAAVPRHLAHANDIPVLEKALEGAAVLDALNSEHRLNLDDPNSDKLLHRFLAQVWAANAPLLAQQGGEGEVHWGDGGAVDAGAVWEYVRFAAEVLGVRGFPEAGAGVGAVVWPIVLAGVE